MEVTSWSLSLHFKSIADAELKDQNGQSINVRKPYLRPRNIPKLVAIDVASLSNRFMCQNDPITMECGVPLYNSTFDI